MSSARLVRHSKSQKAESTDRPSRERGSKARSRGEASRTCTSRTTSGRTSRRNWTFHPSPRVKPVKPEGKRPNRARRCMDPKTQLTPSDSWRKYVSEKICWEHYEG